MKKAFLNTVLMVGAVCAGAVQAGVDWTPALKVTQLTVYHAQRAHEQNDGDYSVPQCNQALSYVRDGRIPPSSIAYPNPGEFVLVKLSNNINYAFPITPAFNQDILTSLQQAMAGNRNVRLLFNTSYRRVTCFELPFMQGTDFGTSMYAASLVP